MTRPNEKKKKTDGYHDENVYLHATRNPLDNYTSQDFVFPLFISPSQYLTQNRKILSIEIEIVYIVPSEYIRKA